MKTDAKHLLPFIFFSILIFFTIDLAVVLRDWLANNFGNQIYSFVYITIIGYILYILVTTLIHKRFNAIKFIIIIISTVIYILILRSLRYPIEKVHFFEYGILAVLAFRGIAKNHTISASVIIALMLSCLTGFTDELIQYFHPNRVGEFGDVMLNVAASTLALPLYISQQFKSPVFSKPTQSESIIILTMLFIIITYCALFFEIVHGYGFQIELTNTTIFKSRLSENELIDTDKFFLSKVGSNVKKKIYAYEGARHIFQRDFYANHKFSTSNGIEYFEYGKSLKEHLILEKFFKSYLKNNGKMWNDSTLNFMMKNGSWYLQKPWESRVNGTMFTHIKKWPSRMLFFSLLILISVLIKIKNKN